MDLCPLPGGRGAGAFAATEHLSRHLQAHLLHGGLLLLHLPVALEWYPASRIQAAQFLRQSAVRYALLLCWTDGNRRAALSVSQQDRVS